jgi:opacity protein-like surface antigen
MDDRKWLAWIWAGVAAMALPCAGNASELPDSAATLTGIVSGARDLLHDGTSRLESLLANRFRTASSNKPDWLREQSQSGLDDDSTASTSDSLQLVVQQDRRDGTDLLTLRYPLAAAGNLRTYAGAGLNRAVYYADAGYTVPTFISRSNRHRSTGAAAELGAELRLSEQVMVNAGVRWVDLDQQAILLRTADGLVGADPVSVGVSLGWRFH